MPEPEDLFGEFVAVYSSGESPSVSPFLERASNDRELEELETMLVAFLAATPAPNPTRSAIERALADPVVAAATDPDLSFADALEGRRKQLGKTLAGFSSRLADNLDLSAQQARVKSRYADLEHGLLSPRGLQPRLVTALAALLELPVGVLDAARSAWTPGEALASGAYARSTSGSRRRTGLSSGRRHTATRLPCTGRLPRWSAAGRPRSARPAPPRPSWPRPSSTARRGNPPRTRRLAMCRPRTAPPFPEGPRAHRPA